MLGEPGHSVAPVYFPQTGMISLIVQMPKDRSVEVGMVGSEGAIGMAVGWDRAFLLSVPWFEQPAVPSEN
jgi:hypothetical protein